MTAPVDLSRFGFPQGVGPLGSYYAGPTMDPQISGPSPDPEDDYDDDGRSDDELPTQPNTGARILTGDGDGI